MMCAKSRLCVAKAWICDEDMDCPDGEDEANCPPPLKEIPLSISNNKSHCTKDEFQCKERHFCIHSAWLCDGDKDCPDGTDEEPDMCKDEFVDCSFEEFSCDSKDQCIFGEQRCDGHEDCFDASDEKNCPPLKGTLECFHANYKNTFCLF